MGSLFVSLCVALSVTDHSTLSRQMIGRGAYLKKLWLPGASSICGLTGPYGMSTARANGCRKSTVPRTRRIWRRRHLAVDGNTEMIMASSLTQTENHVEDPSQVAPRLDRVDADIGSITANGAYVGVSTCGTAPPTASENLYQR